MGAGAAASLLGVNPVVAGLVGVSAGAIGARDAFFEFENQLKRSALEESTAEATRELERFSNGLSSAVDVQKKLVDLRADARAVATIDLAEKTQGTTLQSYFSALDFSGGGSYNFFKKLI